MKKYYQYVLLLTFFVIKPSEIKKTNIEEHKAYFNKLFKEKNTDRFTTILKPFF